MNAVELDMVALTLENWDRSAAFWRDTAQRRASSPAVKADADARAFTLSDCARTLRIALGMPVAVVA